MIRARGRRRHAAVLTAALALMTACGDEATPSPSGLPTGILVIETAAANVEVRVEIAQSGADRSQGLRGRRSLPDDGGMVFLHESPFASSFTMADTLIPLSLAVWGADERILAILDMEPCREAPCQAYSPGVAWLGAVEVNQGFFSEHGVDVGDRVRLER